MNLIEQTVRSAWPLPDRSEIWDWAARSIDFGNAEAFKGSYNVENVPWIREALRAAKNPYVRKLTFIGPPQISGKTKMAEAVLAHRVTHQPAKIAFNTVTNVKSEVWSETRLQQLIHACPQMRAKLSDNRHQNKKRRIIFKDGTFLLIQGAELDSNRQADSIEVQINDELHLWDRPWYKEMVSRTEAYLKTRKIINISIGGTKGSELHEEWLSGNQGEWSHHCPSCGQAFQYIFDHRRPDCNVRFDLTKAIQHEDGRLDLSQFDKTVHVVCPNTSCHHPIYWSEELLARMNAGGRYVFKNPEANPENVSLHVNAFAIGRKPWALIIEPWVRLHLKGGIFATEVLKEFITHQLAEFWEDRPVTVNRELKLGGYTRGEMLTPGGWSKEWIRVMSLDNQRGGRGELPHRWFVCRALARDGSSRLVDCGRLNEWEDCRTKQRALSVPEWSAALPGPWVVVDRAFDPTEVDKICSHHKWFGMLGQDTPEFVHSAQSIYAGQRMLFSEERMIDIGFGTEMSGREFAVYHLWSSQKVQDLFAALRDGKAQDWELPSDLGDFCPEYADHINSHRQKMVVNPKTGQENLVWCKIGGWPDHLLDCETMIVVLGLMAGIFKKE